MLQSDSKIQIWFFLMLSFKETLVQRTVYTMKSQYPVDSLSMVANTIPLLPRREESPYEVLTEKICSECHISPRITNATYLDFCAFFIILIKPFSSSFLVSL